MIACDKLSPSNTGPALSSGPYTPTVAYKKENTITSNLPERLKIPTQSFSFTVPPPRPMRSASPAPSFNFLAPPHFAPSPRSLYTHGTPVLVKPDVTNSGGGGQGSMYRSTSVMNRPGLTGTMPGTPMQAGGVVVGYGSQYGLGSPRVNTPPMSMGGRASSPSRSYGLGVSVNLLKPPAPFKREALGNLQAPVISGGRPGSTLGMLRPLGEVPLGNRHNFMFGHLRMPSRDVGAPPPTAPKQGA